VTQSGTPSAAPSTALPKATATLPPELTRAPTARTIAGAFTFGQSGRSGIGYIDNGVVLLPDGGTPRSFRLPFAGWISDASFADGLRGWAVGRVESFGPLPNCQHAGSRCDDVILATADGGRTWSTQRSIYTTGATGYTFHGIQFIDALHGWTVQFLDACAPCRADLLATEDGGAQWVVRSSAPKDRIFDAVRFVDAAHGWAIETDWWPYFGAASGTTRLLGTSDGGATWTAQLVGAGLYDITALDRTHAWAIARDLTCASRPCPTSPTQLYRTTDGTHWTRVVDAFERFACVGAHVFPPAFADADLGLLASGGAQSDPGGVLISADGGATWSCSAQQPRPANAQQQPLASVGAFVIVVRDASGSDHLLTTSDAGATWTERELPRS
jgi:photosystem II stability/assembly factor-like uncharacterized protein